MTTSPTTLSTEEKRQLTQRLQAKRGIEKLLAVVAQLRSPQGGCPWDLKQTHATLRPYMLEEAYEAVEAMDIWAETDASDKLKEELGDVLLQVVLHSQLGQDAGTFDFTQVSEAIADKLIRRHPHVFAETEVDTAEQVTANWQAIKQQEKAGQPKPDSILDGIPKHTPALSRALETSKRAVKVGFEWPSFESLWACVMSEYDEFRRETAEGNVLETLESGSPIHSRLEDEMGDIFFASVNLARYFKIDPEVALTRATAKFTRRFQAMERLVQERYPEKALEDLDFDTWDALWNEAKQVASSRTP